MTYLRLCLILATASGLTFAATPSDNAKSGTSAGESGAAGTLHRTVPPVLQDPEPSDSIMVRLPGPAPVVPHPAPPLPPPEAAKIVEPAVTLDPPPPGTLNDSGRPYLRRAPQPAYPSSFEKDSAIYCQKLIGSWTVEDATMLLGEPRGSRPAFDDRQKPNGTIWAFSDPTGHYRQIELDFEADAGTLRTVFGYPWSLTWTDCRKQWGANVSAAEANKGRKFYSYLNRRLDVLVDPSGKVISLGLY